MSHPPKPRRIIGVEENFPGCDYTWEEVEFLRAIDRYKRERRRPHPTWREVLNVLRGLGWRREPPEDEVPRGPEGAD